MEKKLERERCIKKKKWRNEKEIIVKEWYKRKKLEKEERKI